MISAFLQNWIFWQHAFTIVSRIDMHCYYDETNLARVDRPGRSC